MNVTTALSATFLFTSLASAHATEPLTNSIGMALVRIEPGTFTMGQDGPPLADYMGQKRLGEMYKNITRIDFDEKLSHKVTITHPFLMGVTEVTVQQYRQFDPAFKTSDPKSNPADDDAAGGVSWLKTVEFCDWLSKKEGKTYRRPTEAEWEYACRAGTTTLFHTGDTLPDGHQKWFGDENFRAAHFLPGPMPREYDWRKAGQKAVEGLKYGELIGGSWTPENARHDAAGASCVALKTPNARGLHDMQGNLAEWCSDLYGPYERGEQTDPLGPVNGDFCVFRGGHHTQLIRFLRSASRGSRVPYDAYDRMGFRVVQGDFPKGTLLPKPPPPLNAQKVNQTVPRIAPHPSDVLFFERPRLLVHVADDAGGPVYSSENHCMTITKCPNVHLLAAWVSTPAETDLTCSHAASRLRFGAKEWEPASPFYDAADVLDGAPQLWWDGGKSWQQHGRRMRGSDDVRPGNSGTFIADYHPSMVDLSDGRWLAFGRLDGVSYDEGKTWRDRRLITPGGPERKWITKEGTPFLISDTLAEPVSYLSDIQSRDGNIQLLTSRNHYALNLA